MPLELIPVQLIAHSIECQGLSFVLKLYPSLLGLSFHEMTAMVDGFAPFNIVMGGGVETLANYLKFLPVFGIPKSGT